MSLRINGATSGSVTLDAPATGSDVSLTLPGSTGTSGQLLSTNGSGVLSFVNGGKILQVVSAAKTDTFTTTSTTMTDITGLSVSITPTSSSNKILILGMLCVSATAASYSSHPLLVRDSTAIFRGDAAGSRTRALAMIETAAAGALPIAVTFLDSPSTTSATTYKFQIRTNNASFSAVVNRSVTDTDSDAFARGVSSITVMEVAA